MVHTVAFLKKIPLCNNRMYFVQEYRKNPFLKSDILDGRNSPGILIPDGDIFTR
jgi:hypothetical protein